MLPKLEAWKQKFVLFAGTLGAPGLFLISFLDSSVLTFPVVNDFLLVDLSYRHPALMPLYAAMAALGSVLGCILIYFLARRGGEALFHRRAGRHAGAIRHWVERNGFAGMLIAALLPPPVPFKVFVIAGAVFEVPFGSFVVAVALARSVRYFGLGFLAARYGRGALTFVMHHKWQVVLGFVVFVAASYAASRIILRRRPAKNGEAPHL